MEIRFEAYKSAHYSQVVDFLIAVNAQKDCMNWNWARWEWAMFHPEFDQSLAKRIGVWFCGEKVVGLASFDMFLGEAFCGVLQGFQHIFPEILNYSEKTISNENGLAISINEQNSTMINELKNRGYQWTEQAEPMLRIELSANLHYRLPNDLKIRVIEMPQDNYQYQLVIWKGFDHGDDLQEFEKSMQAAQPVKPNESEHLKLAVVDEYDRFIAHCQCWYRSDTDYAYVEPVCVIPEYRSKGIGAAVVSEALNRSKALGAKEAYVLSDMAFYKKLGFKPYSCHRFYRKPQISPAPPVSP